MNRIEERTGKNQCLRGSSSTVFQRLAGILLGLAFISVASVKVSGDELALGNLVFLDGNGVVGQFNPATGVATTNAQLENVMSEPVVDSNSSLVVMVNGFWAVFIRINPRTGQQTSLSNEQLIQMGYGIGISPNGNLIVSGKAANNVYGLFTVNPTNGHQTLIATNSRPLLYSVVVDKSGNSYVCENWQPVSLLRYSADGSTRSVITTGGYLQFPEQLALDQSGNVLVPDGQSHAIIRIDPSNGAQTLVSSGANISFPMGIAVAPTGEIFVGEAVNRKLLKIDPVTGAQTVMATNVALPALQFLDNTAPRLGQTRTGSALTLSWTRFGTNYQLEASSQLSPGSWAPVSSVPVETTWQEVVTLPITANSQFFRLQKL
jgi:streptogramin lyase